jgi:hypothetical protein
MVRDNEHPKMPSQNVIIDIGLYGNYVKLQVVFQARLAHLKAAQFEEPAARLAAPAERWGGFGTCVR